MASAAGFTDQDAMAGIPGSIVQPSPVIEPLYDRVIARRVEEPEEEVSGGVIIPEVAKDKPQRGTVVAVGCGRLTDRGDLVPLRVHVGDIVLFGKYSGTEFKLSRHDEVLILREDEVLAILR